LFALENWFDNKTSTSKSSDNAFFKYFFVIKILANGFIKNVNEMEVSNLENLVLVEENPLLKGDVDYSLNFRKDKYSLTWSIFLVLGIGILFPWDCFLSSLDYFAYLFPDFPFPFVLSLIYNSPSLIFLLFSVKYGPSISFSSRILTFFVLDLLVLIFVPIIPYIFRNDISLWLVLFGGFITGCAASTLFGAIAGLAALFPPENTVAIMIGNGVAGIVTAFLRIITKLSFPRDSEGLQKSAFIFFGISAFMIAICIMSYLIMIRLEYFQFYFEKNKESKNTVSTHSINNISVWNGIRKQAITVFYVFFVTLALFPGVTSLITSKGDLGDWFQIILVSLFMLFDFIGRSIPRWNHLFSQRTLWIPTASRSIFFILFFLCIKLPVFSNDYLAYILMALFALSNGYFGTLAMMFGPLNVAPHEKESAGIMMTFFLNAGIFSGALFALLLLYAISGSIGI